MLYMGYEAKTLRDEWMMAHHPDKILQDFMAENANTPLLNMGVIGVTGQRLWSLLSA